MEPALLAGMFALGIASGVHCVGMCGGIVTAFSVVKIGPPGVPWMRHVLFNAGRISTYAASGALAGVIGSAGKFLPAQNALAVFASLVLVLVGLHLAGAGALLRLERLGAALWKRLQPLAARSLAAGNPYAAGLLWGWLPCGLVYGALSISAFGGSASAGAAAMIAFGLGTLPWLLAAGVAAARLRGWMSRPPVRIAAGGTVLAFGVYGLAHAGGAALCL
jgi:sulfite exporter TauE/SafE